ncbi:MAG: zf-HC2 domain-containing protein [Acidimicrobiia bacterium]
MHDLAAPYALDSLDPEESALFEAHLETCSRCRSQLAEMRE